MANERRFVLSAVNKEDDSMEVMAGMTYSDALKMSRKMSGNKYKSAIIDTIRNYARMKVVGMLYADLVLWDKDDVSYRMLRNMTRDCVNKLEDIYKNEIDRDVEVEIAAEVQYMLFNKIEKDEEVDDLDEDDEIRAKRHENGGDADIEIRIIVGDDDIKKLPFDKLRDKVGEMAWDELLNEYNKK